MQPNPPADTADNRVLPLALAKSSWCVAVVGGINMDITATGTSPLLSHDSNPGQIRSSPGGVARNVAENLARLGSKVYLVGVTGDDAFGHSLLVAAQGAGIDVSACDKVPGQRTGTYVSLHGPDGELAVAVNDMDILQRLTPGRLQHHLSILERADALMLDCNLPADSLQWLLATFPTVPVFVDAVSVSKCVRLRPMLASLHTLKVNALEAGALTGHNIATVEEARAAASALAASGVKRVLLTLGDQGVVWRDSNGTSGHLASRAVQVVNATGAGDALLAGVIRALSAGMTLEHAVRCGLVCAEITLRSPHANARDLTVASVQALLSET